MRNRLLDVSKIVCAATLVTIATACSHSDASSRTMDRADASSVREYDYRDRSPQIDAAAEDERREASVVTLVAERAVESVVNIATTKTTRFDMPPMMQDPLFRRFFRGPMPQERRSNSLGSGVFVTEDGLVMTNHHVIEDAEEIVITGTDGEQYEAEIVGSDPQTDLAVLRVKGDDLPQFKPLRFADSESLRLGETVLAIGSSFGLSHTVTKGIVSAKGRSNLSIVDYEDFIQTDAAINPGNSGGALVNLRGELVGINTAILSRSGGNQGVGLAIPAKMANWVLESLVEHGRVARGRLGVVIQDVDRDLAELMELPSTDGAVVRQVEPGSPAADAGLEPGDVVYALNGDVIESTGQLRNRVAELGPGADVDLRVYRNGDEREVGVTLEELQTESGATGSSERTAAQDSGLSVSELREELRDRIGIADDVDGVVVTGVRPNSPAAAAGLNRGDVITEVNRAPVSSVRAFRDAWKKAGKTVYLRVLRDNREMFVPVRR